MWSQTEAVVGGNAGLRFNVANSSFNPITGIPSPDGTALTFAATSNTIQPNVGVFADFHIAEQLRIGGRLSYAPIQLKYSANEIVPIATSNGSTYNATLQHRLRMDFTNIAIEPYVRYSPLDWLAVDVGLPLLFSVGTDYLQTQIFTDPANLTFLDGSVEQITGSGIVPATSTLVPSVSGRVEAVLPLSAEKRFFLVPSVGISQQLGSLHSTANITSFNVNIALGIRYSLRSSVASMQVVDTIVVSDTTFALSAQVTRPITELTSTSSERFEKPDTTTVVISNRYVTRLPKPPAVLAAGVRLSFINSAGDLSEEAQLKIWRVKRTRVVPLLPMVVFDDHTIDVPGRYVQLSRTEATGWKERRASLADAPHWQYNILNIIAGRMVRQPATKLGLMVYDDGTAQGRSIVEGRAKEVQRYMTSVFGIDTKRISIEAKTGQASQQPWLFFVDSTRVLLSPLTMIDTLLETRLPQVKIEPDVISEAGLKKWKIAALHNNKEVHVFTDTSELPRALLWDMNQDLSSTDVSVGQIAVKCYVTDNDDVSSESDAAKISIRHQSITDVSGMLAERVEVLRVLGADYLNTPDEEVFAGRKVFSRVEVYPSKTRDVDFLYVPVPMVYKEPSGTDWFKKGLTSSDMEFYNHVEVYISEMERR